MFLEGPNQDPYFQHGGANAGYRCYLLGYLEGPLAIAIMTNSEVRSAIMMSASWSFPVDDIVRVGPIVTPARLEALSLCSGGCTS